MSSRSSSKLQWTYSNVGDVGFCHLGRGCGIAMVARGPMLALKCELRVYRAGKLCGLIPCENPMVMRQKLKYWINRVLKEVAGTAKMVPGEVRRVQ